MGFSDHDNLDVEQLESLLHENFLFLDAVAALKKAGQMRLADALDKLQSNAVDTYAAGEWGVPRTGEIHRVKPEPGCHTPSRKEVTEIFSAAYNVLPDKNIRARITEAMGRMNLEILPSARGLGR